MEMQNEINTISNKIGYKDVFKQKEYMKLIAANVINRFGDSIDSIAFTWLVYSLTSSAAWSAIIFGLNRIPTIFLQPFAGVLVENMNKKFIMVLADIIRGICVALTAVLFLLNLLNPWLLVGFTIVISSAEAFRNPAGISILPRILDKNCYDFGLSLNSSLGSLVELTGLALAGAIIGFFGLHTAILVDAVTFFGSAVIIILIHIREDKINHVAMNAKEYLETLKGGIDYLKRNKDILNFIFLAMVTNALLVPLNSLLAPLIKNILMQGEYMLSAISFSISAGMFLGAVLYPYISSRLKTRGIVCIAGTSISLYYLILVLGGILNTYVVALYIICIVSSLIMGNTVALLISSINVQFTKRVEPDYLARAGAILGAGCVGAIPVASFAISFLTELLPISTLFLIVGLMGIAFFLVVYISKMQFE